MSKELLVAVCGYEGDRQQMVELMPVYEHHKAPIVFLSPNDSQVHGMGPHICRTGGKRAYIGQDSWDRQLEHMKILLEYDFPWYLINDSDSFCIVPEIPRYLFKDVDAVYSNQVSDFRIPGQDYNDNGTIIRWPSDYHRGFPLIAMQPPYFLSRTSLRKIVAVMQDAKACPITPFIDWWWVEASVRAKLRHKPFKQCASCETVTPLGIAVMSERITKDGAMFIHSVKNGAVKDTLVRLYKERPVS